MYFSAAGVDGSIGSIYPAAQTAPISVFLGDILSDFHRDLLFAHSADTSIGVREIDPTAGALPNRFFRQFSGAFSLLEFFRFNLSSKQFDIGDYNSNVSGTNNATITSGITNSTDTTQIL